MNQRPYILGWFWSGSGSSIPPTNETAPGWKDNPWSDTGYNISQRRKV